MFVCIVGFEFAEKIDNDFSRFLSDQRLVASQKLDEKMY